MFRRRAGDREHLGAAPARKLVGKIRLRLHQHAGPAGVLEMPSLRCLLRPVGADLDEESRSRAAEELAHQLLLAPFRQGLRHGVLLAISSTAVRAICARSWGC